MHATSCTVAAVPTTIGFLEPLSLTISFAVIKPCLESDLMLKRRHTYMRQSLGISLIEGVAIGVGSRDLVAARQQRLIRVPKVGVPVDVGTTEMGPW